MIGVALGVPNLVLMGDEKYYTDLPGGIFEALGRLFKRNVKAYVYPYRDPTSGRIITAETLSVGPQIRHLHAYLLENGCIESIRNYNVNYLHISSQDVLDKIQSGDASWETMVPASTARTITQERLFGWQPPRNS